MNSRFVILCPFYNVKNYIVECYQSVLSQDYDNWIMMFGDDHSTDGTLLLIPNTEPKFIKHYNSINLGPLGNTINLIQHIPNPNPDDILIILDGDDQFINSFVLTHLSKIYQLHKPLLTYGQYISNLGNIGHCRPFDSEIEYNQLRQHRFFLSHARTWKYKIYQKLLNVDPNLDSLRDVDGKFFKYAGDAAMMYSLAEVIGYNQIYFNPEIIYWYRIHDNNENWVEQERVVERLRQIKPLNQQL